MNLQNLGKKIFSVKTDRNFMIITFLGVKLSLRKWYLHWGGIFHLFLKPVMPDVRPNSILVLEPNTSHGEVIPCYVSYLLDLGYNVDVVVLPDVYYQKPLCRLNDTRVRCFALTAKNMRLFLSREDILGQYRNIFITSRIVYPGRHGKHDTVFDIFPDLQTYKGKIVVAEHHLDLVDEELLKHDKIVTLANFGLQYGRNISVNPHNFGRVSNAPKNGVITKFVIIGSIEPGRRNYRLLTDALQKLTKIKQGLFKVTVIGNGELSDIDEGMRNYFDIKGALDFPEMFEELEQADFSLPLLDPYDQNHDRYLTTGTSGSFQLIYGFVKPCLINEKFAAYHRFTNHNSLIYKENTELVTAMEQAIEMSSREYAEMQRMLEKTSAEIYAESLDVIRRVLR